MKPAITRAASVSNIKAFVAACATLITCEASAASFEEWAVPIQVYTAMCNEYPRIVVEFADSTKNIWYPAYAGESAKFFLATALAAKVSGEKMYFLGTDDTRTLYCVQGGWAREVQVFGIGEH
jgi:hypothetical protein